MKRELVFRGETLRVSIDGAGPTSVLTIGGHATRARLLRLFPFGALVENSGLSRTAYVARADGKIWVHVGGRVFEFEEEGAGDEAVFAGARGIGGDSVVSAMPGLVVKVLAEPGQVVKRGEPLVIVEAMKMETPLLSPADGRVKKVHYEKGQLVPAGKPIVEIEPIAEE
jgi:acetyl/propionyl-CoA carboxylase alpha subunit